MKELAYQALIAGEDVVAWVGAFLLALLIRFVLGKLSNDTARKYVARALNEVGAAVAEVWQVYVSELKRGREPDSEDGSILTAEEKRRAREMAIDKAKANIGKAGLVKLAKVLGIEGAVDEWLGNKVEAAVADRKLAGGADPSLNHVKGLWLPADPT